MIIIRETITPNMMLTTSITLRIMTNRPNTITKAMIRLIQTTDMTKISMAMLTKIITKNMNRMNNRINNKNMDRDLTTIALRKTLIILLSDNYFY